MSKEKYLVDIDDVVDLMIEFFDTSPCEVGDYDGFMYDHVGDWCELHCGECKIPECWRKFLELKLTQQ